MGKGVAGTVFSGEGGKFPCGIGNGGVYFPLRAGRVEQIPVQPTLRCTITPVIFKAFFFINA